LTAQTAVDNAASARVLEANAFRRMGALKHSEDGVLMAWRLVI